ncbi:MAG: SpoIIIAC/SpoIIIAD family protein [Clostridia bacterium]
MDILQIVAISIISVFIILLVKKENPELAVVLMVACSITIVLTLLDDLFDVMYSFYNIAEKTKVDKASVSTIIKIIGIGYIAEFGNGICVDAGCKSLGDKLMFASKISILLLAFPILSNLIEIVVGILK